MIVVAAEHLLRQKVGLLLALDASGVGTCSLGVVALIRTKLQKNTAHSLEDFRLSTAWDLDTCRATRQVRATCSIKLNNDVDWECANIERIDFRYLRSSRKEQCGDVTGQSGRS
ncbi:hypothetical protein C0Q70_00438 [Pomacea canaliculata]|uniref:Uncharacterized protein n=1 Tax=Pomacea canaliculata TaxID=400727 RepID=A0A2T7PWM6_POMCA|nr:hypothetical protein C0Q70_00438 [Pomacea canaliculata]